MPRLKSALSCPSCRSPVEEHWHFCHACGLTIKGGLPDDSLLLESKRASPVHTLILWSAALLALAAVAIVAVTIYDFVHQYGIPGSSDVSERSIRYTTLGQEERAINLLEESINIKGSDKNAPQWHELLDKALYSRGKKLAQEGKFRDAVTAFSRISPSFCNHDEVEKLIAENTDKGLSAVFSKGEDIEAIEKERKSLTRIEKAVMTAVPGGKGHIAPPHFAPSVSGSTQHR